MAYHDPDLDRIRLWPELRPGEIVTYAVTYFPNIRQRWMRWCLRQAAWLRLWMAEWDQRFHERYRDRHNARLMRGLRVRINDDFIPWLVEHEKLGVIREQYRRGKMSQTTGFDWYTEQ